MRIATSIAQIDNHLSLTQLLTNVGIELLGQLKRNARQDAKSGWQGRPGGQPPAKRGGN